MDSIETVVARDDVELASGLMWAAGIEGVEERDESATEVRLVAGVPSELTEAVVAALEPRWTVTRGVMETEKWMDAWRPHARAVRVTDRLVFQPPWVEDIGTPGDLVVSIDPGRAWGHGGHPSTVLVAREIEAWASLAGPTVTTASVLDVGCGGGVLAVLAALRGAARILAIDIDPEAVAATLSNAAVNGVDGTVEASTMSVAEVVASREGAGGFGFVVANIGIRVLTELAAPIAAAVAPGGTLVLSGLLDDQADATVAAYAGLVERHRRSSEGWTAVVLDNVRQVVDADQ